MTTGTLEGFLLERGAAHPGRARQGQPSVRARPASGSSPPSGALALCRARIWRGPWRPTTGCPPCARSDWPKASILGDVLSPRYLREHKVLPLSADERTLLLAAADPGHTEAIGAIRLAAGRTVELRVAPAEDIDAAIDRFQPADDTHRCGGSRQWRGRRRRRAPEGPGAGCAGDPVRQPAAARWASMLARPTSTSSRSAAGSTFASASTGC